MAQIDLFRPPSDVSARALSVLDSRARGATFVAHQVKSAVNSPESTGMGFWSINPYVGCEFGCTYCYARYAHRYTVQRANDRGQISDDELARVRESAKWEDFERRIFVKQRDDLLAALDRDLGRIRHRQVGGRPQPLVLGTATDPYQPGERRFGITRAILERLTKESNLSVGIITKSPLVCRDVDVLSELRRNNRVSVYVSLISTDPDVIKRFEARSPMPHVRLRTLKRLIDDGVNAGLIVAPILPGITDTEEQIRALAEAVKDAGGRFAHPSPLRLYPALHDGFLPLIKEHYPKLYPKYRRAYRGTGSAPKHYTDLVVRRFKRIARELDVPVRDPVLEPRRSSSSSSSPGRKEWEVGSGTRSSPLEARSSNQIKLWHA